jgi:hypothetical protein
MSTLLLLIGPGIFSSSVPTLSGKYYNTYDFGLVVQKVIVNVDWTVTNITGSGTVSSYISVSTDGITYTTPVQTAALYADAVRFAHVEIFFTASNDRSAVKLANLKVSLNVHNENDSGAVHALSTDALGTRVTFNKTFQAVNSITVTPISSSTAFAAYNNADKFGFNVFVWDQSGVRITRDVTWIARGVL